MELIRNRLPRTRLFSSDERQADQHLDRLDQTERERLYRAAELPGQEGRPTSEFAREGIAVNGKPWTSKKATERTKELIRSAPEPSFRILPGSTILSAI